jgi:hypothetical protein
VRRRHRHFLTGLTVVALAAGLTVAGVTMSGAASPPSTLSGDAEMMPTALSRHLVKLRQSKPGGMPVEGPGTAADAKFRERAYPAQTIKVEQIDKAKAASERAAGRPLAREADRGGDRWAKVGPSQALYPKTPFRDAFSYVPNEYVAGGRTTAMAISNRCRPGDCRMWTTPAGGGIWRTNDALASRPRWAYLGGPLGINAAGSVTVDPNDRSGKTIYVGTGEANVCGSGCVAGVGIYKSTNGGDSWKGPLGKDELSGKGIGKIAIKKGDPKTLYAATTTALRGMSSVCCSGVTRPVPDAQKWGLYKSTDGGSSWKFVHNGSADPSQCTGSQDEYNNALACSPRGVRHVELDPSDQDIVYAASYSRGIWRSNDAGATWTQIKPSLNASVFNTRPSFDVTRLPDGKTRMYVFEGNTGTPYSRLFRSDDVASGTPAFTDLTSANVGDNGYAWYDLCGGQCWYDVFVHTPEGHPDVVYAGGSYAYGEHIANKRAVVMSTDAGATGTDMTYDGTDQLHPNGLHPDQHDLITSPNNPFQFFEANDGGVMRSSGRFVDRSSWCDDPKRGLTTPEQLARCRQMLARIPSELRGINDGLSTLQFMSLSVSPHNKTLLQGGTQDNGTWENGGGDRTKWVNTMVGDGGQSGFDIARPEFRFHNFFDASTEVNFANGDIGSWIWTGDPINGHAGTQFYAPVISDPKVSGTMFAGTGLTAFRTKTFGLGNRTLEEANRICNSWTGTFEAACGDWAELGPTRLTDAGWGDRAGGAVAAIERTAADSSTAWSATTTGRVFISANVDAADPATVGWTRVDDDGKAPNRFVTSIYVDPANGNRAWVSYSGFNSTTPDTPGHVFEVTYDPATDKATWVDRSHDLSDIPINDLVRDDVTGDLYASNDFGVLRLAEGGSTWTLAARGMPNVEVTGLTVLPKDRILYAASHGLSAWRLDLKK